MMLLIKHFVFDATLMLNKGASNPSYLIKTNTDMSDEKLYIVLMGLPARGKSTLAVRLRDAFRRDGIPTRIFNNGNLRRIYRSRWDIAFRFLFPGKIPRPWNWGKGFARMNMERAKAYLRNSGQIAIWTQTNAGRERRATIENILMIIRFSYWVHQWWWRYSWTEHTGEN